MKEKYFLQEYFEMMNDHTLSSIIDFVKWGCGISIALIIFSTSLMRPNPNAFFKVFYGFLYVTLFLSIIFGADFVAFSLNVEKQKRIYSQTKNSLNETWSEELEHRILNLQDGLYFRYTNFLLSQGIGFLMVMILCLIKIFSKST